MYASPLARKFILNPYSFRTRCRQCHWRLKYVLDALERAEIIKDDKLVVRVDVSKFWCERGGEHTSIELFVLE